jgi:2-methylcitrate dehydratase PrpD
LIVETFREATQLKCRAPASTEEAQYSLPFPVAVALTYGNVDPEHLVGNALQNPDVLRLAGNVELRESPEFSRRFPARRFANVTVVLSSGESHRIEHVEPRWEGPAAPELPEVLEKFRGLTRRMPKHRRARLGDWVVACESQPSLSRLILHHQSATRK